MGTQARQCSAIQHTGDLEVEALWDVLEMEHCQQAVLFERVQEDGDSDQKQFSAKKVFKVFTSHGVRVVWLLGKQCG